MRRREKKRDAEKRKKIHLMTGKAHLSIMGKK